MNQNQPHSSSNSPSNSQKSQNMKQTDKNKRTRRRPRNKSSKDNVDDASLIQSGSKTFISFKNATYISPPSTSKIIVNDTPNKHRNNIIPSSSKGVFNKATKQLSRSLTPNSSRSIDNILNLSDDKHKKKVKKQQFECEYRFIIEPVLSHGNGRYIRRRDSRNKYVNLKSFLKFTNNQPLIFATKIPNVQILTKNLKKFSINQENMTKSQMKKKYPQNIQQNEPSTLPKEKKRKRERKQKIEDLPFSDYLGYQEAVKELLKNTLVKGVIRINPKNSKEAYVSNEDTSISDYYLTSVYDRNRALEGDEVLLRIKPETEWINGKKTATVVYISERVHPRITVGVLKQLQPASKEFAALHPRDKRVPIIRISAAMWPNGFKQNPKQFEQILFVAKITDWTVPAYAMGVLIENLGAMDDLRVESLSILREFCLDVSPFNPDVISHLSMLKDIPQEEFVNREDIRKECVFTIDPATARDLDDAVSVKELPNGNYEVGVHISDASFYLEEGTELDQIVSKKATTIYLVDNVYHMLPLQLCLYCSLLPGEDRLSFSIFWEMTEDGDIINKRIVRTIMNSCTQLAYEHAQMIIENPEKDFKDEEFPPILNGFTAEDIKKTITILQKIAQKLRQRRVENGAIKIDQVKLMFNLHELTGEPLEYWKYENKESHRLIEEFMLLANISVAQRISEVYPDLSFLRCHEPPKQTMLVELQNSLASCGIHFDISSSGALNASMQKYISDDFAGQCRATVLNHITAKAMTRARYFCAATVESELNYKHYALSVPIYTHFTSPIRRYADIMVHRLLAASLEYREKPEWDSDYVSAIATNCNLQKYNAKRADEASRELYLAHYVEKHQPFEEECVVVDVKDKSFDAIVLKTGSVVRIFQNSCEKGTQWTTESIPIFKSSVEDGKSKMETGKKLLKLTITFPKTRYLPSATMIVEMFTLVKVNLVRKKNSYKLEAVLLRPLPTQPFVRQL